MDAMSLLAKAKGRCLDVRAEGDKLVVRGPRSAEKLALQLLDRKPEVLPLLARQDTTAPDRREAPKWAVRVRSDALGVSLWVIEEGEPPPSFPSEHVRRLEQVAPGEVAWLPLTAAAQR
jgi:hypothetical protein